MRQDQQRPRRAGGPLLPGEPSSALTRAPRRGPSVESHGKQSRDTGPMAPQPSREERVRRLIRVGELEVSGEDEAGGSRRLLRTRLRLPRPRWQRDRLRGSEGLLRRIASSVRRPEHQPRDHRRRGRVHRVPDNHHRDLRAGVHALTGRPAFPERPPSRVRPHEHLSIRRPRASCRGMGAVRHQKPASPVGR